MVAFFWGGVCHSREAFPHLNGTHLKDLVHLLGIEVDGPMPTIVHDLIRLLLRNTFPDMDYDEVESIVAKRAARAQGSSKFQVHLAENAELAMDALHNDDMQEVEKEIDELRKDIARKSRKDIMPKPKVLTKHKKIGAFKGDHYTAEQLLTYLPKVKGCKIFVQTDEWHHRITVYYPKDTAPYSCSKSFAKGGSQKGAAAFCLNWAWTQHRAATGVPCPWDLSDVLDSGTR